MKKYQLHFLQNLTLCFLASGIFNACTPNSKEVLRSGEAKIRIINASPDASNINFYINDSLKTPTALSFAQFTPYHSISAGTNRVYVKANRNIAYNSNINLFFLKNKSYTLFLAGKISKDSLIYVSTEDDLTVLTDTTAKVRFVNLSTNSPNLDVILSTKTTDSIPVFNNINFKSGTLYRQFKPGNYYVYFRESGKKLNLADSSGIILNKGKIYTIWAKGLINGSGNYALKPALLNDN